MKKIVNITKIKTNISLLVCSALLIVGCGGDGSKGEVSVDSLLVTVPDNVSPVAKANTISVGIVQGQALVLDASQSSDEDGKIVSYLWQLSDGTNIGEGKKLIYNNTGSLALGTYTLRLIVTDDDGATAVAEVTLFVNARPVSQPTTEPEPNTEPSTEIDNTVPTVTLNGASSKTLLCGEKYIEQNATATDAEDGTLTVTSSGTVDTTTGDTYIITYSATDSDGNTATKSRTVTVTTISHNGISYCTVTSPYTGRVWLDRNLGAARVCTSFDDVACYGDYYQWGRNFDGHQDSGSGTTTTLADNVDDVGHGDFIYSSGNDWASVDLNGLKRSFNWSKTDGSSICPVGFRVPTITELKIETLDNGVTNIDSVFLNFLRLPFAVARYSGGPYIYDQSVAVSIWSSTPFSGIYVSNSYLWTSLVKGYGRSVRCIKN